jgi:hypothetical protein
MLRRMRFLILCMAAAGLAGCSSWQQATPQENSLLRPVETVSDGVQLEIISIRVPYGDEEINGALWTDIDEQQLSPDVRRHLAKNGLRAGIVSGQMPAALAQLLDSSEKPASVSEAAASLEEAPVVSRQQMQLHSGWHGQIFASNTYPELPLLTCEEGRVCGHSYAQAQCVLNTRMVSQGDRQVKLQFTPELQYGEPRKQWIADDVASVSQALNRDGVFRPQSGKPKQVFQRLAFEATLAPEQMLVITTLPDQSGSLGHYFFTEQQADHLQQKLLIIRLADAHSSDLFSPEPGHVVEPSQ